MDNDTMLCRLAKKIRHDIIEMNCHAGSGHPGGALSCADLLTWLFEKELRFTPETNDDPDRDKFILSKGHACMGLYAVLAQKGFFGRDNFKTLRHFGGMLQGHPDRKKTPGVEFNSGSLGQGASFACGCALAAKISHRSSRIYALLGDGELDEGQVWEAFMFASHHQLNNLVFIIDYNKLQSDDYCSAITSIEPLMKKLEAFGLHVIEIDGHNFGEIAMAFHRAKAWRKGPTAILAHTIKGKGISFMENNPKWHGSLAPDENEASIALKECEVK